MRQPDDCTELETEEWQTTQELCELRKQREDLEKALNDLIEPCFMYSQYLRNHPQMSSHVEEVEVKVEKAKRLLYRLKDQQT